MDKRVRQTIDLTEFVAIIDRYAKQERRSRAQMVLQLLSEAIVARKKQENDEIMG